MNSIQSVVDIFLHLDQYLNLIISSYGDLSYLILLIVIFCETGLVVTPFLPGDSLIFGIGTLAATGALKVRYLFMIFIVGVISGDNVNYWIGRVLGPKLFQRESAKIFNKEYLYRTQNFYRKHGPQAIILARFIPIVRTFSPFVAGMGKMPYPNFLLYSIIGGLSWICIFLFGGYFFGNLNFVKSNFSLIAAGIVIISLLPVMIGFFRGRRIKR